MISDFYQCIDKLNIYSVECTNNTIFSLGKLKDINTIDLFCLDDFETMVNEIKQCTLYRMLLRR